MAANTADLLVKQVVRHVEQELRTGSLSAGARLPSERTVAIDLKVSRNTVTAAYNELEERGMIRRIRGRGAFACNPLRSDEVFSWSGKISASAHLLDEPILEVLARTCCSGIPHPLSAGTPSLECFPTKQYQASVNRVIESAGPPALAIASSEGQSRLRWSIARWLGVSANQVMITCGAQEAIDLVARCLIEPGDAVVVESPTYPGAIQCFRAAGGRLVSWDTDWCLNKLEEFFIRLRPKLLFTTPTFQNPTGRVMDIATRQGLLALSAQYHVPIIEDDVYSKTYLNGRPGPPSLMGLQRQSQVICISTFSKILAPGLRVGWIVAPPYMVKQLSLMKMRTNLFTEGLNQLVLSELIDSGEMDVHLQSLRRHHKLLRDAAVSAATRAASTGLLSFQCPSGGLYLWCKLNSRMDMDDLLSALYEQGVSVAPGYAFFIEDPADRYIRVCYTAAPEARISEGINILTETLGQFSSQSVDGVPSMR